MSDTLRARIEAFLWEPRAGESGRLPGLVRAPARFIYALARDLAEGQLTLRAMSLVYTTLLALVPLIAFSLSVLKGFGVHRQIEPLLYEFLQPLGQQGVELTDQVMNFVENIRGGVLGGIGLALLIYTVISMIQKTEDTFNYIWQVQKSRSLARRFSDYLSVVLVGPLLMVTAMGLLASINSSAIMQALSSVRPFGQILAVFGEFLPLILVVLVFAFVYAFVPNTRVQLRAALGGAALAGAVWTFGGSLFTNVIVGSTRFDAIYSSFAIAIFALIWLYLSWLVLLIGAQLAFYLQYRQRLRLGRNQQRITIPDTEGLALGLMQAVARGLRGGGRPDFAALAKTLDYPARSLEEITTRLEAANLLTQTEEGAFVPGRDPDTIKLVDILAAVRGADAAVGDDTVVELIGEVRAAESDRLAGRTLAELVDARQP